MKRQGSEHLSVYELEKRIKTHKLNGSVSNIGRGNWRYRIYLKKGDKKNLIKSNFRTKLDALKALDEKLGELDQEEDNDKPQNTVDNAWNGYFSSCDVAYATRRRKEADYRNHIGPAFGSRLLSSLSVEEIDEFLEQSKKSFSVRSARMFRLLLLSIFQYATEHGLCENNPILESKVIENPKSYYGTIYSENEIAWMTERFQSTSCFTAYVLSLELGLLPNEIFALRLSDLHLDEVRPFVSVTKQLGYQDEDWCFLHLPHPCNIRDVYMTEQMAGFLRAVIEKTSSYREHVASHKNWIKDKTSSKEELVRVLDFLNIKPDGEMLSPFSVKFLARIAKDEMDINLDFHYLKSTFAINCAINGVNPYFLQQQLGNGKFQTIIKYYAIANKLYEDKIKFPPSLALNYVNT